MSETIKKRISNKPKKTIDNDKNLQAEILLRNQKMPERQLRSQIKKSLIFQNHLNLAHLPLESIAEARLKNPLLKIRLE